MMHRLVAQVARDGLIQVPGGFGGGVLGPPHLVWKRTLSRLPDA